MRVIIALLLAVVFSHSVGQLLAILERVAPRPISGAIAIVDSRFVVYQRLRLQCFHLRPNFQYDRVGKRREYSEVGQRGNADNCIPPLTGGRAISRD